MYELTPWGQELEPIILHLGRWGSRSPYKGQADLSVDSLILSFRTMFDHRAGEGLTARYELRFGDQVFHAEVDDGRFQIARGPADGPDAVIEAEPAALAAVVYEGADLAEALAAGTVTVDGDPSAVEGFVTLFALPGKATSA